MRNCDYDRSMPGSIGPAGWPRWEISGVIEPSKVCLKPMISRDSMAYLKLYGHYKSGFLPYAGGLMEQPCAYIDAIEVIKNHG